NGMKELSANQTSNLGSLYKQQGDMTRACAHWAKALGLYREIGMKPEIELVEGWMREAGCPKAELRG
ncbi:MAG TPA: hypothetical protein VKA94_14550, partial [Hyphomicrobiales bacterium]|nr:hypothetical protein [Hyphomicrobiales bacterium]